MSNLWQCGSCGKDFKDSSERNSIMQKVVLAGYANILCRICRMCLEDEVATIAKKYLLPNRSFINKKIKTPQKDD